jgi:hypothetical protein
MPDSDTPNRMLRRGNYLRINMPDMFLDPEFVAYLTNPAQVLATWHLKSDSSPHEYSDCFMQFDSGEGSNSDIPEKWWDLICELCKEKEFETGLLHITNLDA